MFNVYVLYLSSIDQFYIGMTEDLTQGIAQHNDGFYKNSATKKASDWQLFYSLDCPIKTVALRVEKHIKSMKSSVYLHKLRRYPEISKKLLHKYNQ